MTVESNWCTELYKDFDVYALATPRTECKSDKSGQGLTQWDFVVRICESGADPTAVKTLAAHSHDECPLPMREAAEDAGLTRGYGLIDQLLGRNVVQQSTDLQCPPTPRALYRECADVRVATTVRSRPGPTRRRHSAGRRRSRRGSWR